MYKEVTLLSLHNIIMSTPLRGRHIGLLWFAVSRRQRRLRLYHFVDKIPEKLLGIGIIKLTHIGHLGMAVT